MGDAARLSDERLTELLSRRMWETHSDIGLGELHAVLAELHERRAQPSSREVALEKALRKCRAVLYGPRGLSELDAAAREADALLSLQGEKG